MLLGAVDTCYLYKKPKKSKGGNPAGKNSPFSDNQLYTLPVFNKVVLHLSFKR
jgi:hypothetical protein